MGIVVDLPPHEYYRHQQTDINSKQETHNPSGDLENQPQPSKRRDCTLSIRLSNPSKTIGLVIWAAQACVVKLLHNAYA
jgi:hypothetical protein